ncbi:MAG: ERF family protein [Ignavibacteria bacterium]|jgi:hypothetical protein
MMKKSENIKELIIALNECNKEIKNPSPDANNPYYNSKYTRLATLLDELRPILQKNGIVVICDGFLSEQGMMQIRALIMHVSGQWIERRLSIPTYNGNRSDAQTFIGALKYGRRGLISAIFNIATEEDDDGNSLVKEKKKTSTTKKLSTDFKEIDRILAELDSVERVDNYKKALYDQSLSPRQKETIDKKFDDKYELLELENCDTVLLNGEIV